MLATFMRTSYILVTIQRSLRRRWWQRGSWRCWPWPRGPWGSRQRLWESRKTRQPTRESRRTRQGPGVFWRCWRQTQGPWGKTEKALRVLKMLTTITRPWESRRRPRGSGRSQQPTRGSRKSRCGPWGARRNRWLLGSYSCSCLSSGKMQTFSVMRNLWDINNVNT